MSGQILDYLYIPWATAYAKSPCTLLQFIPSDFNAYVSGTPWKQTFAGRVKVLPSLAKEIKYQN